MGLALEGPGARARARHHLQGRLAVAVLEILAAQAVAVHPQQYVALEDGDLRDKLGRILTNAVALSGHRRRILDARVPVVAYADCLRPQQCGRDILCPLLTLLVAAKV